jgi:hypothetical protein
LVSSTTVSIFLNTWFLKNNTHRDVS